MVVQQGVKWIYRTVRGGGAVRERVVAYAGMNDATVTQRAADHAAGVSARTVEPEGYRQFDGTGGVPWGGASGTRCGFCGGKIDVTSGECLHCGMNGETWNSLDHR